MRWTSGAAATASPARTTRRSRWASQKRDFLVLAPLVFSLGMRHSSPGEDLHTCATLRIPVPIGHPLGDFSKEDRLVWQPAK